MQAGFFRKLSPEHLGPRSTTDVWTQCGNMFMLPLVTHGSSVLLKHDLPLEKWVETSDENVSWGEVDHYPKQYSAIFYFV